MHENRMLLVGLFVNCIIISTTAGLMKYETKKKTVHANIQKYNIDPVIKELTNQINASDSCPNTFTRVGDSCYFIEKFEKVNWYTAKWFCEERNSELISIENTKDMMDLIEHLTDAGFTSQSDNDGFWILDFNVFGEGETKGDGECAQVRYEDGNYFLSAYSCLGDSFYICKVQPKASEDIDVEQNNGLICQEEFILIGEKCYRFENFLKLDQFMARLNCERNDNAILTKIENDTEMVDLTKYMIHKGYNSGFWIAGDDIEIEDQFYWRFDNEKMLYQKWADGEPNNWRGEDCVQLKQIQGDYFMNDFDCFEKSFFICESKPKKDKQPELEKGSSQIEWPEENVTKQAKFDAESITSTTTHLFDVECPIHFVRIGNKCYSIQKNERKNWFEAQRMCKLHNSTLIKIKSLGEMNALSDYLISAYDTLNEVWIMGDDIMFDGLFVWGDSDDVMTFTNWAPHEPNNAGGGENCVQLERMLDRYYMNDYPCWQAISFICETVPQTQNNEKISPTALTTFHTSKYATEFEDGCAKDFVRLGEKCYFIQNNKQFNWYAAERQCKNVNAELLTIESAEELLQLSVQLIRLGHHGPDGWLLIGFWTSGNDLGNEGVFYWQSTGKNMTYNNWYENEPNNFGDMEHCVELRFFNDQYYMNDHKCLWPNYFICETQPIRNSEYQY